MRYRSPEELAKFIASNAVYGATGTPSGDFSGEVASTVIQRLKAENNIDKLPQVSEQLPFYLDPNNIFHKVFDMLMSDIVDVDAFKEKNLRLFLIINFEREVAQIVSFGKPIEWNRSPDDIFEMLTPDNRTAIMASLCLDKGLNWDGDIIELEKALRYIHERVPRTKEEK